MKAAGASIILLVLALALAHALPPQSIQIGGYVYLRVDPDLGTEDDWVYIAGDTWVNNGTNATQTEVLTPANGLFISEYGEGNSFGGNNKFVEIFNPTSSSVDLSTHSIRVAFNGQAWALGKSIVLKGVLAPSQAYVVVYSSADPLLLALANLTSANLAFNGDDAIGLYQNGVLIDAIGYDGPDPGTSFTVAGDPTGTVDNILRRKSSVTEGTTVWNIAAGNNSASSQWTVVEFTGTFATDYAQLGKHSVDVITVTVGEKFILSLDPANNPRGLRLVSDFSVNQQGLYLVEGKVKIATDALVDDLTLYLHGSNDISSSNVQYFSKAAQQNSVKDQWIVVPFGTFPVYSNTKAFFSLTDGNMFKGNESQFSGYSFDYLRISKVGELSEASILITQPFPEEQILDTSVTVQFSVENTPFPATGRYINYYVDELEVPNSQGITTKDSFTIRNLGSGRHSIKMLLFNEVGGLLASITRFFEILLPPVQINTITLRTAGFTSLDIEWTQSGAVSSDTIEINLRKQNDDKSYGAWGLIKTLSNNDTNQYTVANLEPATTYHISIRATNVYGASKWAAAAFKTQGVIRKNAEQVSSAEKQKFIRALLDLNIKGTYQEFVNTHMLAMNRKSGTTRANSAHRGPVFLPWHRYFLLLLERALQKQSGDPNMSLMYWKWDAPTASFERDQSPIFSSDFLGGDGDAADQGRVKTGAFQVCTTNVCPNSTWKVILPRTGGIFINRLGLTRAFDRSLTSQLGTASQVLSLINSETVYDVSPFDDRVRTGFRARLESYHNLVHVWIGGDMLYATSPNDPVFYMNHLNVDRIWAAWQDAHPAAAYQLGSYPPGHGLNEAMYPWNVPGETQITPAMMLDYRNVGFRYADVWNPAWETPEVQNFTATPIPLQNSRFSANFDGWTVSGPASFVNNQATLSNSSRISQNTNTKLSAYKSYSFSVNLKAAGSYEISFYVQDNSSEYILATAAATSNLNSVATLAYTIRSSDRFLGEFFFVKISAIEGQITLNNVTLTQVSVPEFVPVNQAATSQAQITIDAECTLCPACPIPQEPTCAPQQGSVSNGVQFKPFLAFLLAVFLLFALFF